MAKRVFVAGAAGAIGRRLVPLLVDAGYSVTGTTRSRDRAEVLQASGVEPVVIDVFDACLLTEVLATAKPDVIIHQLTDLPAVIDPSKSFEFAARNARIRQEGTANLVRAALSAKVPRMIAQSIAWAYAPGGEPHNENAPLDMDANEPRIISIRGVAALESRSLQSPPLTGIVLRYGRLYGPGTGDDTGGGPVSVHVDAAAHAALLAIEYGDHGEPSYLVTSDKAIRLLGWNAGFRLARL